MPPYRYLHLDVFTDRPFTGNQLAVFPEAEGLAAETMQQIAQEMAFSETTFVLPAETEGTDVRMRIFTPAEEMPMAGHPTVGSTFALAHLGTIPSGRREFVFGLGVGPTPVLLEWTSGRRLAFVWMQQLRPGFGPEREPTKAVAAGLGLDLEAQDLAAGLPVQEISCGVPFLFVPLATRDAVDRAVPDSRGLARLHESLGTEALPVFLFSTEGGAKDEATVYSRMFAPGFGIMEDPATGGASGALGCYLVRHGLVPPEHARQILSLQGVKMGRPSRIYISIDVAGGEITAVQVGGTAVLVGEGTLTAGAGRATGASR